MNKLEDLHPVDILRLALAKCEANRDHCLTIPSYSAIALEWNTAIGYINKAIEEIDL